MAAGSSYSDQQRREAVGCYLLHGNWRRVSEITSVPQRTLNDWATQPWYGTVLAEVRAEKGAELEGAFSRIIELRKQPSNCLVDWSTVTLSWSRAS